MSTASRVRTAGLIGMVGGVLWIISVILQYSLGLFDPDGSPLLETDNDKLYRRLMAGFPRPIPADAPPLTKVRVAQVNELIAPLENGQWLSYLDIGRNFLQPDGTISPTVMPDYLHPSR